MLTAFGLSLVGCGSDPVLHDPSPDLTGSALAVVGNPTPVQVLLEPLDENGLDAVTALSYPMAPEAPWYPAVEGPCIGAPAAAALATEPPGTVELWLVRMADPWPVDPVDARYIASLNSAGRWAQGAWDAAVAAWKADRTAATAAALSSLELAVAAVPDCAIVDEFDLLPYAVLSCTVSGAQSLWTGGAVECLDLHDDGVPDVLDTCTMPSPVNCGAFYPSGFAGTALCTTTFAGGDLIAGHGLRDFLPNPYTPAAARFHDASGDPSQLAVVLELGLPRDSFRFHPGFTTPTGASRVAPFEACSTIGTRTRCTSEPNRIDPVTSTTAVHHHIVGSMTHLFGSVIDGQQPARDPFDAGNPDCPVSPVVGSTFGAHVDPLSYEQLENDSALARRVSGHVLATKSSNTAFTRAMQRTIELNAQLVNYSASTPPDCTGRHARARAVSDAFEAGVAFFKSAGNYDTPDEYGGLACNVGTPGDAIAAFTVAALAGPIGMRLPASSHGSATARRSLVDMSANGSPTEPYYGRNAADEVLYHRRTYHATSLAAPTVASASLVYRRYYETLPDEPTALRLGGFLYARLLLQADRQGQDGTDDGAPFLFRDIGFDANYGAGRLAMEPIFHGGTVGYDATNPTHRAVLPALRQSRAGTVCVGQNELVAIPMYEVWGRWTPVTAVGYTYDSRHAKNGALSEIELNVFRDYFFLTVARDQQGQEKMRVHADLTPDEWFLGVHGRRIDGTSPGCPAGKRRVYFAYKWNLSSIPGVIPWQTE